jgi:hypothetical protein
MLSTSKKNGEMDSNVLVDTIEKYIYGGTPMCYALN